MGIDLKSVLEVLEECRETIRLWHGMGMRDSNMESRAWDLYWNSSPEMKRLAAIIDEVRHYIPVEAA